MTDKSFGAWLQQKYIAWSGEVAAQGRKIPSQADFAGWLDVPTTSLSTWMNSVRTPSGEAVDKLADKLGMEVYDRLGVSRRMPKSKKLYEIASLWGKLDNQGQDELYEHMLNLIERKKGGNHNTTENTAS